MAMPPPVLPPVAAISSILDAQLLPEGAAAPSPQPVHPGGASPPYNDSPGTDSATGEDTNSGLQPPHSVLRALGRAFQWPCANCTCENALPPSKPLLLFVASVLAAQHRAAAKQEETARTAAGADCKGGAASASTSKGPLSVRSASSAEMGMGPSVYPPGSPNAAMDMATPRPSPQPEDDEVVPPGLAQAPARHDAAAPDSASDSDEGGQWSAGAPHAGAPHGQRVDTAATHFASGCTQASPEELFCGHYGVPPGTMLPLPPLPPLDTLRCAECGRPAVLPETQPSERLLSLTLPQAVYRPLLEALGAEHVLTSPLLPPAGSLEEYGMIIPHSELGTMSSLPGDDASVAGSDSTAAPRQPLLQAPADGSSAVHQAVYCGAGAGVDVPDLLLTSRTAMQAKGHFTPFLVGRHAWRDTLGGGLPTGGTPLLSHALSPASPNLDAPPGNGVPVWGGGKGLSAISALQRAASRAVDTPPPPGAGRPDSPAPPGLVGSSDAAAAAAAEAASGLPPPLPAARRSAAQHAGVAGVLAARQAALLHPLAGTLAAGYGGLPRLVALAYDPRMLLHHEAPPPTEDTQGLPSPSGEDSDMDGSPVHGPLGSPQGGSRMLLPRPMPSPHPERPDRLRAVVAHLAAMGLFQRCWQVPTRCAHGHELATVHTAPHCARVGSTAGGAPGKWGSDTYYNGYSHGAALLAAGGVLEVTRRVAMGHASAGLALVRPPGHHAEPDAAMGFCLYNNVAVAAAVALRDWGAKRVMVVDWDVHHGNGTQAAFVNDPRVLYVSLHRYEGGSFYPGTGGVWEVGEGDGTGSCVNVAWPRGGMGDAEYMAAFDAVVMPIGRAFDPDLVLVSAGFDAAEGDPLGGCRVTPSGYAHMTAALSTLAAGRIVVALEGGYNLSSISNSTAAVASVLLGDAPPRLGNKSRPQHIWDELPVEEDSGGGEGGGDGRNTPPYGPGSATPIDRALGGGDTGHFSLGGLTPMHSPNDPPFISGSHGDMRLTPAAAAARTIVEAIKVLRPYWPVLHPLRKAHYRSAAHAMEARAARAEAQRRTAAAAAASAAIAQAPLANVWGVGGAAGGGGGGVAPGPPPGALSPAGLMSSRFSVGSWAEASVLAGEIEGPGASAMLFPSQPPPSPSGAAEGGLSLGNALQGLPSLPSATSLPGMAGGHIAPLSSVHDLAQFEDDMARGLKRPRGS